MVTCPKPDLVRSTLFLNGDVFPFIFPFSLILCVTARSHLNDRGNSLTDSRFLRLFLLLLGVVLLLFLLGVVLLRLLLGVVLLLLPLGVVLLLVSVPFVNSFSFFGSWCRRYVFFFSSIVIVCVE